MRYAKDSLVISPDRDIPLLRQVRNSKFVSHRQLFELMKYRGSECSPDSFNWRIRRLVKAGCLSLCKGVFGAGSAVYRITNEGLTCSNITANLPRCCTRIARISHIFRRSFIPSNSTGFNWRWPGRTCWRTGNRRSKLHR
jgi:hypothetical protein